MDPLFLLKNTASIYVHPLTIAMELIVLGIVLVGFSRRQRRKPAGRFAAWLRRASGDLGIGLVILGVFFLFLCSISPVSDPLVYALEKRYPPLPVEQMTDREIREAAPEFILVLGGGERFDPGKPPTSQLSYPAMARVNEGARLAGLFPEATVVFTGQPNETRAMTEAILAMGISRDRVVAESESRATQDHPVKVRPIIGDARFLLVTSATHMPRSMRLFEAAGYRPTPAPCDFWVWPAFGEESPYQPALFVPTVENLMKSHQAIHEYLGLAWMWMESAAGGKAGNGEAGSGPEVAEPDAPPATPALPEPRKPVLPLPEPGAAPPRDATSGGAPDLEREGTAGVRPPASPLPPPPAPEPKPPDGTGRGQLL